MPFKIACQSSDSEKHELDINHLYYYKGTLYSGSDDGRIKAWSPDLKLQGEVQAHSSSVYCLTVGEDSLYSCSSDGTIKAWDLNTLKAKSTVHEDKELEFWRIGYSSGCLFSGDQSGTIRVYKHNKPYGFINIADAVKDMVIDETTLFTSNLLDVEINQIFIQSENIHYEAEKVIEGKAPLALLGKKICFTSREGKDIVSHENNRDTKFPKLAEHKNAHTMIINSITGTSWDGHDVLFSAGWDKVLKKWKVDNKSISPEGSVDVGFVVTSITAGEKGQVFAGGENGVIKRVDVD